MKHWNKSTDHTDLSGRFDTSAKRVITVDVEKYQHFLDGSDMTDAQKEEYLQTLWSIIMNFVELGFGVHPLQEVCGQIAENGGESADPDSDALKSEEHEEKKYE